MYTQTNQRIIKWFISLCFFAIVIVAWEFFVRLLSIPFYLLPTPSIIAIDIVTNINLLLFHTGITFLEAFLGFIIANIFGILIAILFIYSKTIERGTYPYIIALQATPLIAIAPLLVIWFGNGIISKIVAAAIVAVFPVIINTTRGFRNIDDEILDLFKSLSAKKWQIFSKLRFPMALPYIFSALKISTTLSIVGAMVAELIGANKGLGFLILISSYHLEIVRMFSAIIMATLTGVIFFGVMSFIEKKVVFWITVDN